MNKTVFKTYLIYFIAMVLFVGVRIASSLGVFSLIENDILRSDVATIIIQAVIMFLVPLLLCWWLLKSKPKQTFKTFGFKKISGKAVLICFGIGILMFFLNLIVASFFSSVLYGIGYDPTGSSSGTGYDTFWKFLDGVVFVAIMPGICEEFIHRGLLMRNIGNQKNYKVAIVISAVCFGLMHLNIEQVFYATILGLIIGFVGAVSDSIFPCMILHFTNNFMSVYLSYAQQNGLFGGDFYTRINSIYANNSPIVTFIFTLLILVLLVFGIGYLTFKLFKQTKLAKLEQSLINVQKEVSGEDLEQQSPEKLSTDFRTLILPHLQENQDALSVFLPPSNAENSKSTILENTFLIGAIFMGVLITIFTLVWGIL